MDPSGLENHIGVNTRYKKKNKNANHSSNHGSVPHSCDTLYASHFTVSVTNVKSESLLSIIHRHKKVLEAIWLSLEHIETVSQDLNTESHDSVRTIKLNWWTQDAQGNYRKSKPVQEASCHWLQLGRNSYR